jgi:hypothetical protein
VDIKDLFFNCNSSEGSLLLIIQCDEPNKKFKSLKYSFIIMGISNGSVEEHAKISGKQKDLQFVPQQGQSKKENNSDN